jgi:hypothetical protein
MGALVIRAFVYPPLLAHVAPRRALAAYTRFGAGEPLGVLGISARAAVYEGIGADAAPTELRDPRAAYAWLTEGGARRWLLLRAADLPALNALYRAKEPLHDVAVVEGHAGILLAASTIPPGAGSTSPLARILPNAVPTPQHPVDARQWTAYPMSLWQPGDIIVDDFEASLPTHFGRGDYPLSFGFGHLPCADDRRLEVTHGPHDANRVRGGLLRVE